MIRQLKSRNLGILITDHNVRETLTITDHAYIIHEGKILLAGESEKIVNDPLAKEFYLGEKFTM
jgi:lipopolysaccharide export system ATP-binding protein